jgi:hypothetical protein
MAILWSGEKNHLLPFADRILDGGFPRKLEP